MAQESIARRGYRSELRQRQAEQTRSRILASAAELFAADGYARTTLAKIAAAAGVSTETVQGQGSKAELLIAAMEYVSVGVSGEENLLNLDIGRRLAAVRNPSEAVELAVDLQVQTHQRSAGLAVALVVAANGDAEVDEYLTALTSSITGQARRVLEIYRDRGWLRDEMPFDEFVETVAVLFGVDTFIRITRRDGWTVERYRSWLRTMLAQLFFVPLQQD